MAKGFDIRAFLGLDTKKFSRGLNQARGKLTTFQKGLRGLNDTLRGLKFAAVGVTAVGAFSRAITVVKDFQTNMARVGVISQANEDQMKEMTETVRELGATTRFSASEAAGGLQYLAMAGLSADEAMTALPDTLNLAGAAMVSVGEAADIATNILGGFGLGVEELTRVSDIMAHTTRSSNTNFVELYEGMKEAAPIATQLGVGVEEVATSMAIFANAGIKGQRAGVGFVGVMTRLLKNPKQVADSLREMGLSITETNIRQEGFLGTMKRLKAAGISATQMTKIFGLHVKTAGIFANESAEDIDKMSEKISNFEGAAAHMSKQGIGAIDRAIKLLLSALDELFLKIGENSDGIVTFINWTRDLVLWISELTNTSKVLGIAIIALGSKFTKLNKIWRTSAKTGKIARVQMLRFAVSVKTLGASIKTALGPVGWLVLAIEGLMLVWSQYSNRVARVKKETKEKNDTLARSLKLLDDLKNAGEGEEVELMSDKEVKTGRKQLDKLYDHWQERVEERERKDESHGKFYYQELIDKELAAEKEYYAVLEALSINSAKKQQAAAQKKIDDEKDRKKQAKDLEKKRLKEEEDERKLQINIIFNQRKKIHDDQAKLWEKEIEGLKLRGLNVYEEEVALAKKIREFKLSDTRLTANEKFAIEQEYENKVYELRKEYLSPEKIKGRGQIAPEVDEKKGTKSIMGVDVSTPEVPKTMEKVTTEAEKQSLVVSELASSWAELSQAMGEAAAQGSDSFDQMVSDVGNMAREIIKIKIAEALAYLVTDVIKIGGVWGMLAAPAVAMAGTTLFNTLIPKFATGGIVGGMSFSGDNVPAMVNSGEMVLNKGQQANLFKLANGNGGAGGGMVEFEIKGDKLVGVLNNNESKNRRFK